MSVSKGASYHRWSRLLPLSVHMQLLGDINAGGLVVNSRVSKGASYHRWSRLLPLSVHMQLLGDINAGGLVVNSRSMGLFLAPAAEKVRPPPPQALATAPPGARPGFAWPGSEQVRVVSLGQMGRLAGNGVSPVGPTTEPQSPVHRGGVDINYLRLHDLHL